MLNLIDFQEINCLIDDEDNASCIYIVTSFIYHFIIEFLFNRSIIKMMKILIFLIFVLCVSAFDVEIESFQADSKYANTGTVNYGTLRVTKRSKNYYTVSGDFEMQRNIGEDISVMKLF